MPDAAYVDQRSRLLTMRVRVLADEAAHPHLMSLIKRADLAADLFAMTPDGETTTILTCGEWWHQVLSTTVPVDEARGYVHRINHQWVVPTLDPTRLLAEPELEPILIHDLRRAAQVAREGHQYLDTSTFVLDPLPAVAQQWTEIFEAQAHWLPHLSVDIETAWVGDEDDESRAIDVPILRCGYSYHVDGCPSVLSMVWGGISQFLHARLLKAPCPKVFWNKHFDVPILRAAGLTVAGTILDGMDTWHVLNPHLRRGLGFVSSFLCPQLPMWKHLSQTRPAYYNALDAYAADWNQQEAERLLHTRGLWSVYHEQVLALNPIYDRMQQRGLLVDAGQRQALATEWTTRQQQIRAEMQDLVPLAVRGYTPPQGYVRPPSDLTGCVPIMVDVPQRRCGRCGVRNPPKAHTKTYVRKVNPCAGATVVTQTEATSRWTRPNPFVPSTPQILAYMRHRKHHVPTWQGRPTADQRAIRKARAAHPADPLYPLIQEDGLLDKWLGTYVGRLVDGRVEGGLPVHVDGRIHGTFTHAPSTLRVATQHPNLQNLPPHIRSIVCAAPGSLLVARDFAGIEAVLVGVFAGSGSYTRLARLGVHDYFLAHGILRPGGLISEADVPQLRWSDDDLLQSFRALKRAFKTERDIAKRVVHLSNYLGTPVRMHEEYPEIFPTAKEAARRQTDYFALFPEIRQWHDQAAANAERAGGWVTNPSGFKMWFGGIRRWRRVDGGWQSTVGAGWRQLVAALPSSTAAYIGKQALVRVAQHPLGGYLSNFIHDEILAEVPLDDVEAFDTLLQTEMERPVSCIPLDPAWGLGSHLTIRTEGKRGQSWGTLH